MKTIVAEFRVLFTILCLASVPKALALVPPPDGGYSNFTTAEGTNALKNLTTGAGNTGVGWYALFSAGAANNNTGVGAGALALNTADNNTAVGTAAMFLNTTGPQNTAFGTAALVFNNGGEGNTATGAFALYTNTEGDFNTANGEYALYFNDTGERNTAIGDSALYSNTEGSRNTAIGNAALLLNIGGSDNTAVGADALSANVSGIGNIALGHRALSANTGGGFNTAVGRRALLNNVTGVQNTAVGFDAGINITGTNNTAVGGNTLFSSTGNGNTALGAYAGGDVTTANNVICIGASGANVDNSCYVAFVWNQTGGSQPVYVNSDGKLGLQVSSRRFKDDIEPIQQASEVIYRLKPVSFRYKAEIESKRTRGFGLIAEDVEQVSPDLVTRGNDDQVNAVRYDAVNAMLLNEFLKEHRKVEKQATTIEQQAAMISKLEKKIEAIVAHAREQDSEIQRVRDQVQVNRSDARLAVRSQ
jgi:trimeric autotransporter adhesin